MLTSVLIKKLLPNRIATRFVDTGILTNSTYFAELCTSVINSGRKLEYAFILQNKNNCGVADHGVQTTIQEIGGLCQSHVNVGHIIGEEIIRTGLGGVYQRVPLGSYAVGQRHHHWKVACVKCNIQFSLMLVNLQIG